MSEPPDEDIVRLPVQKKDPPGGECMLVEVPYSACRHYPTSFTVDVKAGKCWCRLCNGEVSPIFVLQQLMNEGSIWRRERAAYQDEMKRLGERSRTKCQHCGQMTRVSRR